MSDENIRVLARVKLIGKSASINAVTVLFALFRFAAFLLGFLYLKNFNEYRQNSAGRTVLIIGAIVIVLSLILLECMRTLKDRWYSFVKTGHDYTFSELTVSFGVRDLYFSLVSALLGFLMSVLRFVLFFFVPVISLFITQKFLASGVSNAMLAALITGNIVLFCCALAFWLVSLNCVSLARSLCVGDIKNYGSILYALDKNAFRLFRFGAMLSVINRGSRRLAKIMYADSVS